MKGMLKPRVRSLVYFRATMIRTAPVFHTLPATVFDKSNGPSWPWVVISGTVSHGVARGKGARHMRGVNVFVVAVLQNYTVRGRGPLRQVAPFTSVARKPGHEARLFPFCIFFNMKA